MNTLLFTVSFAAILLALGGIWQLLLNRKRLSVTLFREALQNENSGQFETAILGYETALAELRKSKFQSGSLMHKITGKLKVLRTLTRYQANFHYENQRWPLQDIFHGA